MTITQLQSLPEDLLIDGDHTAREVCINGKVLRPFKSQQVWNHSPDGFNWGYSGSGPAQLALAILLNYMSEDDAVTLHQAFKFKVVASWPKTDFEVRLNLKEVIGGLIVKEKSLS